MSGNTLYLVVLLLIIIVVAKLCIVKVPDNKDFITERKGKFFRVLSSGVHFINPFSEKIVYQSSLADDTMDLKPATAVTEDGQTVTVTTSVTLRIVNAKSAYYKVGNYRTEITKATVETLQNVIAGVESLQLEARLDYVEKTIQRNLNKISMSWGVMTLLVEIKHIDY